MSKSPARGFTLVELLVAIAIVAVLATIALVSFAGLQKNARDSKRINDVQSLAKALETHYLATAGTCDLGGGAGTAATPNAPSYCPLQNGWFAGNLVPTDPQGSANRIYCLASNNSATKVNDPAAWTTACPAGFVSVGANVPALAVGAYFNYFKICASLENGGVNCIASQQQ